MTRLPTSFIFRTSQYHCDVRVLPRGDFLLSGRYKVHGIMPSLCLFSYHSTHYHNRPTITTSLLSNLLLPDHFLPLHAWCKLTLPTSYNNTPFSTIPFLYNNTTYSTLSLQALQHHLRLHLRYRKPQQFTTDYAHPIITYSDRIRIHRTTER